MENHSLLEEPGSFSKITDPCIIVIFGATGDLTARKLMPALYNLAREGLLPTHFACVGVARRVKTHEEFRADMEKGINAFSRVKPIDPTLWNSFKEKLYYLEAPFDDDAGYEKLSSFLSEIDVKHGTKGNRIFYFSVQPSYFPLIAEKLHTHHLLYDLEKVRDKWSRIIIEKPFGHDLLSALDLQKELLKYLSEEQIFRIDHYLGKETVQNILVFRFANSIFEPLWNNRCIDHVQITVAEDIGIGSRGKFWEETGLMRDIVQNHMMQLLSLVAMEPPTSLSANAIRDEKVKVIQSIRPISGEGLDLDAVRGQYDHGLIEGKEVPSYRSEKDVSATSTIETFVALRLFIDNWRWAGVPFYLRGGKRLPKKVTEIAVTFKDAPGVLFQTPEKRNPRNVLSIRIQPDEGIALKTNCKVPGANPIIQPVQLDFRYGSYFGFAPPEAYERLIWDCILGDGTLFAREDEVFNSWKLITPILEHWKKTPAQGFPNYLSGSWGPVNADALIAQDGHQWRIL